MKALITLMLTVCTAMAQMDPTDTNYWGNGSASTNVITTPQQVEHGAIITAKMTGEVIEWWNLEHNLFTVEWREKLTDGSWTNIGYGTDYFEHNYPDGFYRVIALENTAVFPVWNSGTTDMVWSASSDATWLDIECVNTNIPPEWGQGYVIATVIDVTTNGMDGVISVFTGSQTQQCTVVIGE